MGRRSTGANTIGGSFEICLSHLQKTEVLVKGQGKKSSLEWSRHGRSIGSVTIVTDYRDSNHICILLIYSITVKNEKIEYNEKIELIECPTNFDPKRKQLYFICPDSGRRCRKLYRAYGSHTWKSRKAYQNRLYYSLQLSSKLYRANSQYWNLDSKIEDQEKKRKTYKYNGKLTKRYKRLEKMKLKQQQADYKRFLPDSMPLALRKMIEKDD